MEGITVGKATVCGTEGIPSPQPSIAEEGYGFVVRITQALMKGAQRCEQFSGNGISEGRETDENFRTRPPIPHKQPVFIDHLFCLSGFAE